MIRPGSSVLVAFSGGPDSTVLLRALHASAGQLRITLRAAHYNHCLRGDASDEDAKFAEAFAKSLNIPIHIERAEHLANSSHVSEEQARIARHEFLQRVAASIEADAIALGHTADDRAESVLLNLLRGTGIAGLGSIRPVQGNIIRPLIDASRRDVEAYISDYGLPFRVDETNADTSFTRNWVRLELLPLLEERFNSKVRGSLARLADIAADESDLMQQLAESARQKAQLGNAMDADILRNLPVALLREVIRCEIRRVKSDLTDITYEQVESIVAAIYSTSDSRITLTTGDIYATRRGSTFRIHRKTARFKPDPFAIELTVPGVTDIEPLSARITAEFVERPRPGKTAPDTVLIDSEAVSGNLTARNVRPGDRIAPFGMKGTKKLQDVFVDGKIPVHDRDWALVVTDDEKILWVAGVVASEACRVTDKTTRAIRLKIERDQ